MFKPVIAEKRKGEFVQQGDFLQKITTTQNPKLDSLPEEGVAPPQIPDPPRGVEELLASSSKDPSAS